MRKILSTIARYQRLLIALFIIFAALFPFLFKNQYYIRMGTLCLMYIMLALSMNLIMGYMGQMSFGHAAFWGIGAYTAAIMGTRLGTGTLVHFFIAALITGVLGFCLALPVLKLKGYYLTIVTFGFCEIVRLIELNSTKLTGGPLGIRLIPSLSFFGIKCKSPQNIYYVALIMVILITICIKRLVSSRFGIAIKAIRDDDSAAEVMGIPIVRCKILTFVISAIIAGLAGVFYAQYVTYIDSTSFTTAASQELCVMVILGGLGSLPGTFLGASVLTVIPELLRGLQEYRMLIYGVIMVMMMLFRPQGFMGYIDFEQIRQSIKERQKESK